MIFLSLAMAKRYSELHNLSLRDGEKQLAEVTIKRYL